MSTRCQIGIYSNGKKKIENYEVLLYKHCDGYPEGVIPIIKPFLKLFKEKRGLDDTEYLGAWLIHHLISENIKNMIEFEKKFNKNFNGNVVDYTGFGICCTHGFHGDIEYFYRIHPSSIKIYRVSGEPDAWECIKTIKI